MSWAPTTDEICERALRRIGAFAIRSSGARPPEMEEARYWLDMHIGHLGARMRTWWLVPGTGSFPLVAGLRTYDLLTALGPAATPNGIEFVIGIYIDDATTGLELHELNLLRRQEYEAAINAPPTTDAPTRAWVSRDQKPTLNLVETPDAARSYRARVLFQGYGPGVVGAQGPARLTQLRTAWTLYIVTALAALIGNGPVRKLPADEVQDMKKEAAGYLLDLEAYEGQEQNDKPQRVQFYNGV